MDALTVYRRLHDAGVSISADGGKLLAGPATRLTDDLRDLIRAHKPALVGLLTDAHETTASLLVAAMRVCDWHGDGEAAREQMRRDCMATPPHLQADLLNHFRGKRPDFAGGNRA